MDIRVRSVNKYPLEYNHDTSQLCTTGHDNVSHRRMTTLALVLSELFPLDGCNIVDQRSFGFVGFEPWD